MTKNIDINKLIEVYRSEMSIKEICKHFGISKQTVYNLLKANGCELRRQKLYEIDGCPLFERDIYNQIYCMDCGEWEHLSLSFKDKKTKNAYKKNYCNCKNYVRCSVYKVMCEAFV